MRKRPRNDCTKFYNWLFTRVPYYEEQLMRAFPADNKKHLCAEPTDVRLLPNLLRRVHAARGNERKCARRLRMPLRRFVALSQEADAMLDARLRQWLRRLPKKQRLKERARRRHADGWIGKISVEPWQPSPAATDRWASIMHR